MNRRHLLKLVALPLACMALSGIWLARKRADALFAELFGDPGIAAHMGRLSLIQDEQAGARGQALAADLASLRTAAGKRRLREHIDADLETLELVVVDGWVMAKSEADLCAAVHLDRTLA